MNSRYFLLIVLLVFGILTAFAEAPSPAPKRVPVIVELFTSEGCSSCPPADALLVQLNQQGIPGADVIALGQHVDYWNHLGWADRFSSAKFSHRQNDYSNRFGLDSVYTPQMVVNGHAQFVGNDPGQARKAITDAASQPEQSKVVLSADGTQKLEVEVSGADKSAQVMLAITEDNLTTEVARGENGGRTLRHAGVVRDLRKIGDLKQGKFSSRQALKLSPEWRFDNLHAVVFLQNPTTMQISGAASVKLK